jgi:hypothetical protein
VKLEKKKKKMGWCITYSGLAKLFLDIASYANQCRNNIRAVFDIYKLLLTLLAMHGLILYGQV